MPARKSILLIIDSALAKAPRAQTMIRALKNDYDLTVAALGADGEDGYKFEPLKTYDEKRVNFHFGYPAIIRKPISGILKSKERVTRSFPAYYFEKKIWNETNCARLEQFDGRRFDAIICHHAKNLPVAAKLALKMKCPLFFNAHEYYIREFEDSEAWVRDSQPLVEYIFKTYSKHISLMFTVSYGIADAYRKNLDVPNVVIPCVKPYYELSPRDISDKILLVHNGYANEDRKIETMIEMCRYLDSRFEFHFYLIESDKIYFNKLKSLIEKTPNAKLLEPITPEHLINTLNKYDIGIYIIEPTNFNVKHMLPNKFYEYIQARLAIAISPAEEMGPILTENNIGIIASDHSAKAMADKLNTLSKEDILTFKKNADAAAKKLAAEAYYPLIKEGIEKYLAN